MKVRFLADENLRKAIVLGVRRREPSVSFAQAFELGIAGKVDRALLQIATDEGRILVSQDIRTMPWHFRQFIARQTSPGVILVPQKISVSIAIEELLTVWLASDAEEWLNQIRFLPL